MSNYYDKGAITTPEMAIHIADVALHFARAVDAWDAGDAATFREEARQVGASRQGLLDMMRETPPWSAEANKSSRVLEEILLCDLWPTVISEPVPDETHAFGGLSPEVTDGDRDVVEGVGLIAAEFALTSIAHSLNRPQQFRDGMDYHMPAAVEHLQQAMDRRGDSGGPLPEAAIPAIRRRIAVMADELGLGIEDAAAMAALTGHTGRNGG